MTSYNKSTDGCTGSKLLLFLMPSAKWFLASIYHLCVEHDFYYRNDVSIGKTEADFILFYGIISVGVNKGVAGTIIYFIFGVFALLLLSVVGWAAWIINRYNNSEMGFFNE